MEHSLIVSIPLPEFVSLIEGIVRKVLTEKCSVEPDRLLNSFDVMQLLGISRTTLQAWRDSKKIPFLRIGNKIFYNQRAIMDIVQLKAAA